MRVLFSVTLFVAAALMFLLELIFAKMILPLLGGSPSVWVTSLLFFQAMLLAGYAYGHVATRRLGPRRGTLVQLVVVALAVGSLPFAVPAGWVPPVREAAPVPWVLLLLLVAVGLPFFALASSVPLVQSWFAAGTDSRAADPYFLYRASNLGSLVGLLAYPLLIEPNLTLGTQRRAWEVGYVGLLVLLLACTVALWRPKPAARPGNLPQVRSHDRPADISWVRRLRWVALAFVPSALLLGITAYLTTDLAPVPLLWVIPMSLYLLSFILVFSPRHNLLHRITTAGLPFAVLPLIVLTLLHLDHLLWIVIPLSLIALFLTAMVCHGEMANDRPDAGRLTEFYLCIAVGGLLGGVAIVLVAPLLFTSFVEVPLALAAACLLRPGSETRPAKSDLLVASVMGGALLLFSAAARASAPAGQFLWGAMLYTVASLTCVTFTAKPRRFGFCLLAIMLAAGLVPLGREGTVIYSDRDFFGTTRVVDEGSVRYLFGGNTVHGAQSLDPARRLEPLTYFARTGPLGDVFGAARDQARVGVIGLGTGSIACYERPGDSWTFYEINPDVIRVASDPALFTFMRDCPGSRSVVAGDARLSIASAPPHGYGVLVVDAFNSDAIPVHLLTRQALALYGSKLAADGLIAFNVSNRYLNLAPVLGNLAADAGWVAYERSDRTVSAAELAAGKTPSTWVVMARQQSSIAELQNNPQWRRIEAQPGARVWTDDYSDVLGAVSA